MNIFAMILIGLIAGYLASLIMRGRGLGVIGDIVIGVVGALIGGYVFSLLGITTNNILGVLITATIGAIILPFIISLIRREPASF